MAHRCPGRPPAIRGPARARLVAWVGEIADRDVVTCETVRAIAYERLRARISRATAARLLRAAGFSYAAGVGWRPVQRPE